MVKRKRTLISAIGSWRDEIGAPDTNRALAVARGKFGYGKSTSDAIDAYMNLDPQVYRSLVKIWNKHAPVAILNPVKRRSRRASSSLKKATSSLRRSMTIRKGNKSLKILPQAGGMVKAVVGGGAKAIQAIFSSVEEALKWGLAKIGLVTNPERMKVIRAIRNPSLTLPVGTKVRMKRGISKGVVVRPSFHPDLNGYVTVDWGGPYGTGHGATSVPVKSLVVVAGKRK